jgi:hypothetical protein
MPTFRDPSFASLLAKFKMCGWYNYSKRIQDKLRFGVSSLLAAPFKFKVQSDSGSDKQEGHIELPRRRLLDRPAFDLYCEGVANYIGAAVCAV